MTSDLRDLMHDLRDDINVLVPAFAELQGKAVRRQRRRTVAVLTSAALVVALPVGLVSLPHHGRPHAVNVAATATPLTRGAALMPAMVRTWMDYADDQGVMLISLQPNGSRRKDTDLVLALSAGADHVGLSTISGAGQQDAPITCAELLPEGMTVTSCSEHDSMGARIVDVTGAVGAQRQNTAAIQEPDGQFSYADSLNEAYRPGLVTDTGITDPPLTTPVDPSGDPAYSVDQLDLLVAQLAKDLHS